MSYSIEQGNWGGVNVANTGRMGDVRVTVGTAAFWIERFGQWARPGAGPLPPSRLLAARHEAVGFIGRRDELARLRRWRDGAGGAAVLVHGPGGQGKTRLGVEFAKQSVRAGWAAAEARHHSDVKPPGDPVEAVEQARGLLLLVDYAERWPRSDLLRLFQQPLLHQQVPVRVLLLARPASRWWASLRHPLGELGFAADELELSPLADTVADRLAVFEAARDALAAPLGVDPTGVHPPSDLSRPEFGLALTLHMAALVAVDAAARGAVPPADPGQLSAYLLDRERHYWATAHANGQLRTDPATMARTTFLATLAGPLPPTDGGALLDRAGLTSSPETARAVLDDHASCYPIPAAGSVLAPLLPDRLAEDFVADQLTDPVTADMLVALLAETAGPALAPTRRVVRMLVETARRWPQVGTEHLAPLLAANPRLALADASALLTLAELADLDLLARIEPLLPERTHPDYQLAALAIVERLAESLADRTGDDPAKAAAQLKLGRRLSQAGHLAEATAQLRSAVAAYRQLAARDRAYEPALGEALKKLGGSLVVVEPTTEARSVIEEAVAIYERLAAADPAHEIDLAQALNDLALWHDAREQFTDAEAVAERAVAIYEQAGATHQRDLALTLRNLAYIYAQRARPDDALAASERSLGIYRWLYVEDPPAYRERMATALSAHADFLARTGHKERAAGLLEEAVTLFEPVLAANPHGYRHEHSTLLHNLGIALSAVGRIDEALDATREAVDSYRPLIDRDTSSVGTFLAHLHTFIDVRRRHGRELADANRARAEAEAIVEQHTPDPPAPASPRREPRPTGRTSHTKPKKNTQKKRKRRKRR